MTSNPTSTTLTTTQSTNTRSITYTTMRPPNNKFIKTLRGYLYVVLSKATTLPYLRMVRLVQEKHTPWKVSGTTCTMIKEVLYPELFKISSATSSLVKIKT